MWIKKSEWEDMNKTIKVLATSVEKINKQVNALNKYHRTNHRDKPFSPFYFRYGLLDSTSEVCTGHHPENPAANTQNIPNLTFSELASYVIDGTPIVRKQEIEVEYI